MINCSYQRDTLLLGIPGTLNFCYQNSTICSSIVGELSHSGSLGDWETGRLPFGGAHGLVRHGLCQSELKTKLALSYVSQDNFEPVFQQVNSRAALIWPVPYFAS